MGLCNEDGDNGDGGSSFLSLFITDFLFSDETGVLFECFGGVEELVNKLDDLILVISAPLMLFFEVWYVSRIFRVCSSLDSFSVGDFTQSNFEKIRPTLFPEKSLSQDGSF